MILERNPNESLKKENSKERCFTVCDDTWKYKMKVKNRISVHREVIENCINTLLYLLLYAIKLQWFIIITDVNAKKKNSGTRDSFSKLILSKNVERLD